MTIRELFQKCQRDKQKTVLVSVLAQELYHDLDPNGVITSESVVGFYLIVQKYLQYMGMTCSSDNGDENQVLWQAHTHALGVVRTVLVQEFQIDLPEARVVSVVQEIKESRLFVPQRE